MVLYTWCVIFQKKTVIVPPHVRQSVLSCPVHSNTIALRKLTKYGSSKVTKREYTVWCWVYFRLKNNRCTFSKKNFRFSTRCHHEKDRCNLVCLQEQDSTTTKAQLNFNMRKNCNLLCNLDFFIILFHIVFRSMKFSV